MPGSHSSAPEGRSEGRCTTVGSPTRNTTSDSTETVVSSVNSGGAGSPSGPAVSAPPPARNTAHSTNAGTASANSFTQYWNACTSVTTRIPPATMFSVTIPTTTSEPIHGSACGRTVRTANPAACSCGKR